MEVKKTCGLSPALNTDTETNINMTSPLKCRSGFDKPSSTIPGK